MTNKHFDYCNTCGAAEYPNCSYCEKPFWHRAKGVNLNAAKGTGVKVQLCPSCATKRFVEENWPKKNG
jgi:hypothetical protein